jgi:outer membrane lipoprotein-sorting protein
MRPIRTRRTSARIIAIAAAAAIALGAPLHASGADTPASDFITAWAAIDDYTATIATHETNGKDTQDRVYHYAYKKPHFAKIDIIAGPGRGGGAVWTGGVRVKGHQGGFLSGIKLTVAITDGRATSLRGDTIDRGSFQSIADDLKSGKAESVTTIETVDGVPCDLVSIDLHPATPDAVSRSLVAFARTTHMPVRRTSFAGDAQVKQEDFSEVKLNAGLTEADFN